MTPQVNIVFTDSAALQVKQIVQEEQNQKLMLRLYIEGGGCAGFKYGFTLDEHQNDDDWIIENAATGIKLLVDAMSGQYLAGAEVDYQESVEGGHFVIRNPNAKTTCGCGSSISI